MRMAYPEFLTSPEIEIAEGGTMLDNKSKFADLKTMLDNTKENVKMEAMKRIINMVARGKDVSELFPAVVKCVAAKNLELKKLVYVYLVRYAEEQQDLALLSISTFQRALKDPNQLIRAGALRVLSSIRVQMIAPVMLLAIKECVRDMSAYVRKVAAHAIPKLYALDPELQPQLIECIDFLLGDKRTLVLGSAVHAFEQTCPERIDLLHRHFRALCRALADVDEWGQVVMIGLLTRYARTQFTSPGDLEHEEALDPDHSFLILSAKSLLQSRNCAVVMAVAQLLYYIAPSSQLSVVPRALIRLLRGPNEVQYVILINIATICNARNNMVEDDVFAISKNLFEPFLKSFFVRSSDTKHVKQLKLQVLTSLVTETNVQLVIRELQAYLQMSDLTGPAIEAIGRCALQVDSSTDTCLSCLVNLISSPKEEVVCEAVVVLKRLLHREAPYPLLKKVVRLMHTIKASPARACVVWLIYTHIEKAPDLAPDLLRIMAKSYADEADIVKLQTLTLAVRLWATDRERCELLVKYVLQLARYDIRYDIRDRCRLIRNCLFKESPFSVECFLSAKPSPTMHSQFSDREHYQLGTLSHLLNQKCAEYTELPSFPDVAPDPSIRRSAMPLSDELQRTLSKTTDSSEEEEEDEDEEEEDEEEEAEEGEEESEEESEAEEEDSEEESEEKESEEEESEEEQKNEVDIFDSVKPSKQKHEIAVKTKRMESKKNDLDLLLDLNFDMVSSGVSSKYSRVSAVYVPEDFFVILSAVEANGLSVRGRFNRSPSVFSNSMINVEIIVRFDSESIESADVTMKCLKNGDISVSGDLFLGKIRRGEDRTATLGIDFGDSGRRSLWNIEFGDYGSFEVEISAPLIEQLEAIEMSADQFNTERQNLSGMTEHRRSIPPIPNFQPFSIYRFINCKQIRDLKWCFASQTISRKAIVLIQIADSSNDEWELRVNCENAAVGSLLSDSLRDLLHRLQ